MPNFSLTKRRKIIFSIILFGLLITVFSACLIYLRNINIYNPFSISFTGISLQDSKLIKVYSISPINRENPLQYEEVNNYWRTFDDSFHKSIKIILPDTLAEKIKYILITIDNQKKIITVKDLIVVQKSVKEHQYILPANISDEKSFFKVIKKIGPKYKTTILYFILAIVLLFIVLYIGIKLKKKELSKKTVLRWTKTFVFSIIIAFGIFYGYLLFNLFVASYITSVLFILLSCILLWYLAKIIIKIFGISVKHSGTINKVALLFLLIWFCTETTLRVMDINKSYNEKLTNYYSSGFINKSQKDEQNPHLFVLKKNSSYYDQNKEFTYEIKTNADGLRDIDHPIEKEKNEYRIICLGNSYTEGVGTPQDSTWPRLLEDNLKNITNKKISVFNAGISGYDPFFEYMLLNERMLKYKPDLVLVALGSSDFNFYRFRGGFERFTADGFHYRKGPWWEKLYAISYIFRFYLNNVLHYKYKYLQSPSDYRADSIKADKDIENCVARFYQLSLKEKFKLAIIFIDDRGGERYAYLINKLNKENIIPVIDLTEYNKNIEKLNPSDLNAYFWPIDKHCKSGGYELYSKGIMWNFKKMGIIDSLKTK